MVKNRLSLFITIGISISILIGVLSSNNVNVPLPFSKQVYSSPTNITNFVGIPAIHTRYSYSASDSRPNFSIPDVAAFVHIQRHFSRAYMIGTPSIQLIQFMTINQADQVLSDSLPLNGNTLVCLVIFNNKAEFAGPNTLVVEHHLYEIFDAHTGNILDTGGMP